MNVLIGCEFSGVVRRAFRARGHNAWSCDLLPAEDGDRHHLQDDITSVLAGTSYVQKRCPGIQWDLGIFHPPCTFLCNSGVRWLSTRPERWKQMEEAAWFFKSLLDAKIPRVAVENPVMHKYAVAIVGRKQDFSVQPWQFGEGEIKRTCFWTRGLPQLVPTKIVSGRHARVHRASPSPDRWKERSRTLAGIADAMAEQWGSL